MQDDICREDAGSVVTRVQDFVDVPKNNVDQLIAALQIGPVSVAVSAHPTIFVQYKGGIINDPQCGIYVNHGVLAVGFGIEGNIPYFIIKNSWAADWGE